MVPFKIKFTPGQSIFDQVCFAAIKSILAGELKAGEAFPLRAHARAGPEDPSEHRPQGGAAPDPGTLADGSARRRNRRGAAAESARRQIASACSKTKWKSSWWKPCAWARASTRCSRRSRTPGPICAASRP